MKTGQLFFIDMLPSVEAILDEKSKPRILVVDPMIVAHFGDLLADLRKFLESRCSAPAGNVLSVPQSDPAGSQTGMSSQS